MTDNTLFAEIETKLILAELTRVEYSALSEFAEATAGNADAYTPAREVFPDRNNQHCARREALRRVALKAGPRVLRAAPDGNLSYRVTDAAREALGVPAVEA